MKPLVSAPYLWAFVGSFVLLLGSCYLLLTLGIADDSSRERYQDLSNPLPPTFSRGAKLTHADGFHERRGVRRDLLRNQSGQTERLAMRLHADKAQLHLDPESRSLQESLEHINVWSQQKVDQNLDEQTIKYFESAQACYSYHEDLLTAYDATLSEVQLPGASLPEEWEEIVPLYALHAEHLELSLRSREKEWKASAVQGTFSNLPSGSH